MNRRKLVRNPWHMLRQWRGIDELLDSLTIVLVGVLIVLSMYGVWVLSDVLHTPPQQTEGRR